MSKVKVHDNGSISFYCPGCKERHILNQPDSIIWNWNGDIEKPTFSPSVLVKSGHYAYYDGKHCWCKYNAEHPDDPAPFKCYICHSFVTDGKIQYLDDCTHELAGQTVEMRDED
jgi:hypothetical protein